MDPEYASSALRNLNKQEFKGRKLRVCNATNDKTMLRKSEMETDEYQNIMSVDETTMKPSEIIAQCTAKQKVVVLEQLLNVLKDRPGLCDEIGNDYELMRALATVNPVFTQDPQMVTNKLMK